MTNGWFPERTCNQIHRNHWFGPTKASPRSPSGQKIPRFGSLVRLHRCCAQFLGMSNGHFCPSAACCVLSTCGGDYRCIMMYLQPIAKCQGFWSLYFRLLEHPRSCINSACTKGHLQLGAHHGHLRLGGLQQRLPNTHATYLWAWSILGEFFFFSGRVAFSDWNGQQHAQRNQPDCSKTVSWISMSCNIEHCRAAHASKLRIN